MRTVSWILSLKAIWMPDRYDPKLSIRPAGDRKPSERPAGQGSADDPLAELARIVSGRADPAGNPGRTETPGVRVPPASQPQPLPSEADLARDLESELLNELQASFSTIPEVVGRPATPEPPPQQPAPAPPEAAPVMQTDVSEQPPVTPPDAQQASPAVIFPPPTENSIDEEFGYRPPFGDEPHQSEQPPAGAPRAPQRQPGPPRFDQAETGSRISPPPSAPRRESLAARIARAAQGGNSADATSNRREQVDPPMSAAMPPVRSNNRRPADADSRPEGDGAPFRPTLTPNYAESEPVAPPVRAAATRWDPAPEADTQPPIDASRFAPLRRDGLQATGQEPSAEPDALAEELPYANVDETYFDEAYGNQYQETVPGYGDDELPAYTEEDMAALDPPRSRRGPLAIAVLLTVVVFAGAAVILFRGGTDEPPPIVTADTSPTKIAPDDAGASDSEGQAKLIYDRIDPAAEITDSQLVVPGGDAIANIPPIPEDSTNSDVSRVILEGGPGTGASGNGTGPPSSAAEISPDARSTVARSDGQTAAQIGPKRVRTVVVRPDGTIVSSEAVAADEGGTAVAGIPPASETPPAPAADENPLLAETFGVEAIDNPTPAVPAESSASVSVPDIRPPTPTSRPPASPAQPTIVTTPGESSGPIDLTPGTAPTGRGGGFLVQVSSQRSEQVALASFNELQRRYPSILGDREPDIQRADLGERGVYYRVRVGYPTREQAAQMCESLKSAGGDCLLATR